MQTALSHTNNASPPCSKSFGGMDIVTVDAIHAKDGKEYILEMNGTSSGLGGGMYTNIDMGKIRDLVQQRMAERCTAKSE